MKNFIKGLGICLIALALVVGVGAGHAEAVLTLGATSVVSDGALTLNSTGATAITIAPATAAGTIVIGKTDGTGDISIGASTGAQAINLGTGNAVKTIVIGNSTAGGASVTTIHAGTGGLNLGTTADARTIAIGTGNAIQTINIGNHATPVNVISLGGAASTLTIGATLLGASPLVFEASTADAFELTLAVADVTADRTVTIPDRAGTVQLASACSALTPGAAVTLTVGLSNCYTDTITTDNQDQTITFSGAGTAGEMVTIIFQTDAGGAADEVITFHTTLTSTTGTLTLANVSAQRYVITFISDGTIWNEVSRTAVQPS